MNLYASQVYPLSKFLYEELTGQFFTDELSCLNRMLILYNNRYMFDIRDDTSTYLDEFEAFLGKPFTHWWIPAERLRAMNCMRGRFRVVLRAQRRIFEDMIFRNDYATESTVIDGLRQIYWWAASSTAHYRYSPEMTSWASEIKARYGKLLDLGQGGLPVQPSITAEFYQLFQGANAQEKEQKFESLIAILIEKNWILSTETPGVYVLRSYSAGSRLQIGALYHVLNTQGHIQQQLPGARIAALFNSWLLHSISKKSFEKIFQPEQQQLFDCTNHSWHKYVLRCQQLLADF